MMRMLLLLAAVVYTALASHHYPQPSTTTALITLDLSNFMQQISHAYLEKYGSIIRHEALCYPNSRLRKYLPPVPKDLFESLKLDPNRTPVEILDFISSIIECPAALKSAKHFEIQTDDLTPHSAEVADGLHRLLNRANDLETIIIGSTVFDCLDMKLFSLFHHHPFQLPQVKTMKLGSWMDFLIPIAPKLTSISINDTRYCPPSIIVPRRSKFNESLDAISVVRQLKEVELCEPWDIDFITDLVSGIPGVEKLRLNGDLIPLQKNSKTLHPGDRIKGIISELASLENLVELGLPDPASLDIGIPYEPNKYWFPRSIEDVLVKREMEVEAVAIMEKAGELIRQALPNLKRLCFRGYCTDIVPDKELIRPWMGGRQLRGYLLQKWPRFEGYDSRNGYKLKEDPKFPVLRTWEDDEKWFPEFTRGRSRENTVMNEAMRYGPLRIDAPGRQLRV